MAKHAVQVSFALIGANWALYGTQAGILSNGWATTSLFVAVGYLVLQLVLMQAMVIMHKRLHSYAEADRTRWAKEYDDAADKESAWPYTKAIEDIGSLIPWLHVCVPILSGALLLASVFFGASVVKPAAPAPNINSINVGTIFGTNTKAVEKLGTISGFSLGDTSVPKAVASNEQAIAEIARRWRQEAAEGRNGVLVFVGSVDRVPLSNDSRRRFEDNFGLASSRADVVKRAILAECLRQDPGCGLRTEQMLVLASGPVLTQAPWSKSATKGYPDDRRVDVWALWAAVG